MDIDSVIFYTNIIEKVKEFYSTTLEYSLEYEQEGKYLSYIFANLVRNGIKKVSEERELPGSQTIFISCPEIDNYYNLLKNKGVAIHKDIIDEPWGRNFSILDPDGNKIQFVRRHSQVQKPLINTVI